VAAVHARLGRVAADEAVENFPVIQIFSTAPLISFISSRFSNWWFTTLVRPRQYDQIFSLYYGGSALKEEI
jgi:hypothetical protein